MQPPPSPYHAAPRSGIPRPETALSLPYIQQPREARALLETALFSLSGGRLTGTVVNVHLVKPRPSHFDSKSSFIPLPKSTAIPLP